MLGVLAFGMVVASPVAARPVAEPATAAQFRGETVSADARDTANWVTASHDNHALPFVVIDKANAKVFAFDGAGVLRGAAPALLGMARGDDSVPGIGQRKLATITPPERTTPAGRFQASLGRDFEQDILWIDYEAALSLHRVIKGRRVDDRAGRLASPTPSDNRISYGCVNVPPGFYDGVVKPLFTGTVGIVYILPETKPLRSVFAVPVEAK
nr:L,D-transpeptidase [Sphingomonas faeni]